MPRYILMPQVDSKNKETQKLKTAIVKANRQNEPKNKYSEIIVNMSKPGAIKKNFFEHVLANDIVEIHAEGTPWDVGTENYSQYDFTAFKLAHLFNSHLMDKKIKLTIELHCCNSGTIAKGPQGEICFAQDFSAALYSLGLNNITVVGYAGFVQSERPLKQSVVSEYIKHGAKVKHCNLEDAAVVYENGKLKKEPLKRLVDYTYSAKELGEHPELIRYLKEKNEFEIEILSQRCESLSLDNNGSPVLLMSTSSQQIAAQSSDVVEPKAGDKIESRTHYPMK